MVMYEGFKNVIDVLLWASICRHKRYEIKYILLDICQNIRFPNFVSLL